MTGSDTVADYDTLDLWLNKIMGIQKIAKKKKKLPWFWSGSLEHKCTQGRPGRKNQQEF